MHQNNLQPNPQNTEEIKNAEGHQGLPNSSNDNPDGYEPEIHKKIKQEHSARSHNPAETVVSNQVLRSREIHKQLQNKKSRWKPNKMELSALKTCYQSNQYPTKEEKEKLLEFLGDKLGSSIDLNQIARWFQHQREKTAKIGESDAKKSTYKKFDKEELDYLQDYFTKMIAIAKKLGSSYSKIENWFKHNRRSLARKGLFELKNKKYFKKNELDYLNQCFTLYIRPSKEKYKEMAKTLSCDESHIKNWYSNQRKKRKLLAKKNNLLNGHSQVEGSIMNDNSSLLSHITKQNGMSANPLQLNLPMTQSVSGIKENSSSDNRASPSRTGTQTAPRINGENPVYINGTYPVTTNGAYSITTNGVIPIITSGTLPLATNGGIPNATNGSIPVTKNGSIPIATNTIPIAMNGFLPIASNGGIPVATNGTIPLGTIGGIPIQTNGGIPIQTNGGIPIQTNGGIPTTIMTNQGIPISTNGTLPIHSNRVIPINPNRSTETHNSHQPQFYQLNHHQNHHSHKPPELSLQGNRHPMSPGPQFVYAHPNGQLVQPQFYMVPSNQVFSPYGQLIQVGQQEIPKNSGFYYSSTQTPSVENNHSQSESRSNNQNGRTELLKPHLEEETKKPERAIHLGRGGQINTEGGSSSNNSDESTEAQTQRETLMPKKSGGFGLKPIVNCQQPQGSTSDKSNSNSNSSGSGSSPKSNENHHQAQGNHKENTTHQLNGMYKVNNSQQLNGSISTNPSNSSWVYTNGHPQGGTMYMPVSQPYNLTSTTVNGQPQVSCYLTIVPPWQNGAHSYGPTYLNNSYIYNNSTTFSNYNNGFSNYNNGFSTQPNGGMNTNTIITDFQPYKMNNFQVGAQASSSFENAADRQSSLPKGLSSSPDAASTQTKTNKHF